MHPIRPMQLSWAIGFNAKLHYIVFGADYDEVNNVAEGTLNGTTNYNPGPLKMAKTYYWRMNLMAPIRIKAKSGALLQ